jgi:hypothetical protein
MEEDKGVFQRLEAGIDSRLGAAGATGLGRAIRRGGRWIAQAAVWIGMGVFVAAVSGVLGTLLYVILHALHVVPGIHNGGTNWWFVGGAAVGALYLLGFAVWYWIKRPDADEG